MSDDDPYALKPGFDYHLAEVRHNPMLAGMSPVFFAVCGACGFVGPDRSQKSAADDDAYTHDVTHNE